MSYNIDIKDTITFIDPYEEDGAPYAKCVDPHVVGDSAALSCPICEAPIEARLVQKDSKIPTYYTAEANQHVNVYKIIFQTCDCPVVAFQLPDGLC